MKIIGLLMCFVMVACGPGQLNEADMLAYALDSENGLIQRVEKSNTVLEIYYKPKDLIIQQESKGIADARALKAITERLDSLDYFVVRLARGGKEIETSYATNSEHFNDVVNYLAYYMAEDLQLIHERDTLSPLDLVYARTFGTADATSVMAVFKSDLKNKRGLAKLVFDDRKLGTGRSEFDFNTNDIKNIPPLKR